jgi:anionic cell wall polymer biosynthesis LytR-Cps2A-Psr (LCP) family protein
MKMQIVIGTVIALLAGAFFWLENPLTIQPMIQPMIQPIEGHWLKTGLDKKDIPMPMNTNQNKILINSATSGFFHLQEAKSVLNRKTDCMNIMYVWTDNEKLKVISVTSFNKATKQASIVVVPLTTVAEKQSWVKPGDTYITIRDLYQQKGSEGVRRLLEEQLDVQIPVFIHVNQGALRKLSDIVGVLEVTGGQTTMLEAFEQTAAGIRTDDREVVKAVTSEIMHPRMIAEIPKLVSIFTTEIKTNLTVEQMVRVFYFSREMDMKNMRKTALPGYSIEGEGLEKYLFVSEQVWKNIIYDLTQ